MPKALPSDFHLSKWYADCVSDSGDTIVVYHGVARWGRISLQYASLLQLTGNGPAHAQHSVARIPTPSFDGSDLLWKSEPFRLEGVWHSVDAPHSEALFSSSRGSVEWHCLQPRARAEVRWGKNQTLTGLGYSERVELSIAPWEIPIQQLLWGRFLSNASSLVWVDWRGPFAKRVLLHNGAAVSGAQITNDQILLGAHAKLTFGGSSVLRQGKLGSVALSKIPGVKEPLPRAILGVQETKWRSRAHLSHNKNVACGWAIHEVVNWPR